MTAKTNMQTSRSRNAWSGQNQPVCTGPMNGRLSANMAKIAAVRIAVTSGTCSRCIAPKTSAPRMTSRIIGQTTACREPSGFTPDA